MATTLRELIDNVNADDLPTNEFTIEDKDPMVILGKLNEVIAYLQTLQDTINASDSKATEALQKAIQAVADATQALSVANGIDAKATQALANAIEAVETANTALSASNTALSTANTAIGTANTALSSANSAVESAESAETKADTAITTANGAKTTAEGIDSKATTALSNSQTAVSIANNAKNTADEALSQVVSGLGTKVYVNDVLQATFDADTKANQSDLNTTNNNVATNTSDIATNASNIATLNANKANQSDLNTTNNNVETNRSNIAKLYANKANQSDLNATNANVATNATNIATNASNIANKANTDGSNITVASYQDKLKVGKLILNYTTTSNMSSINLTGLNLINDGGVYDIEVSYKADVGVDANIQVNGKTSNYNMILLQAFDKGSYSIAGGPNSSAFAIGSVFPNETLLHLTLNQTDTNNAQLSFINIGSDNSPHVYARWGGGRVNPNGSITSIKINSGGNILAGAKIKIYAREK